VLGRFVAKAGLNLVDIVILVAVLAFAALGYERGLIAGTLPLLGFVGGAAVGARIGQALLAGGSESEYAPVVALLSGVLLGAFAAVMLGGVAAVLRGRLRRVGALAALDGIGGASLFGALALLLAWALGAVALHTPAPETRQLREAVQRSTILATLNDVLPPSGPVLNVLRRVDPRPEVRGPRARVGRPSRGIVNDPDVQQAAASTVRVLGTACGLGVAGSGWVAGPNLVVTNAHVVAGQEDTTVVPAEGGASLDAQAVRYQPRNDLAVLRVPGLGAPALSFAGAPEPGTAGAAIGYPEGGERTLTPARLGSTGTVVSEDSYGRGPVERTMTPFRGVVRSGNSGGPIVDANGQVMTTVFAAALDGQPPSGLGIPNGIVAEALQGSLSPTGTGPCVA
jgi:S1-C subfamily serine protease